MGNSRIKFALVNDANSVFAVEVCNQVNDLASYVNRALCVLVSNVGDTSNVSELETLSAAQNIPFRAIQTQKQTFGINCAYEQFENLGVDRWLALLGARIQTDLPIAVLDLGTANTCDLVVDNQHLGGWIAPGYSLMKESLLNNTQQVFGDDNNPTDLTIGENTQDCVSYGCLASQMGFVAMAEQYLSSRYQDYRIFITGGAQKTLTLNKNNKIIFHSNLVLQGLTRFI